MTKDEALKLALEALENNRQTHHYCEDTWYSCPKHEDGCANDAEGDECNCGADKANAEIDATITAIKEALMSDTDGAQPEPWEKFCDSNCVWTDHHPDCKLAEQEPVAWMFQHEETGRMMFVEAQQLEWGFEKGNPRLKKIRPVYTTPLQRTWVGLTDEEREEIALEVPMDAVLITEAKLKEKNT